MDTNVCEPSEPGHGRGTAKWPGNLFLIYRWSLKRRTSSLVYLLLLPLTNNNEMFTCPKSTRSLQLVVG